MSVPKINLSVLFPQNGCYFPKMGPHGQFGSKQLWGKQVESMYKHTFTSSSRIPRICQSGIGAGNGSGSSDLRCYTSDHKVMCLNPSTTKLPLDPNPQLLSCIKELIVSPSGLGHLSKHCKWNLYDRETPGSWVLHRPFNCSFTETSTRKRRRRKKTFWGLNLTFLCLWV